MAELPPFLLPFPTPKRSKQSVYHSAVFPHGPSGQSHCLWWPAQSSPELILIFIPGNPGLIEFYIDFLSLIHQGHPGIAILAHAHLGHTPALSAVASSWHLHDQTAAVIRVLDAVHDHFPVARIIMAGHSVGSWIISQVAKARPENLCGLFLLFPTLSHIAETPNGRILSKFFSHPWPTVISRLCHALRFMPTSILSLLMRSYPQPQLLVLQSLLRSPLTIYACLSMAHEEMLTIKDLEPAQLQRYGSAVKICFAVEDDWVGSQRDLVLSALAARGKGTRAVIAPRDVPHAFCIQHSHWTALQCLEWLKEMPSY